MWPSAYEPNLSTRKQQYYTDASNCGTLNTKMQTCYHSLNNQNNTLCYRRFDFTSEVFIRTEHVYVGETGRPLGVRIKEHRKEVDSITGIFTRAEKSMAASVCNKSAITDHVCNENHVIDWDKTKVIDRESDKSGTHIREAIWIRKTDNMNRDEGSYQLSHVWDKFLHTDHRYRKTVLMKTSDVKSKRQ